MTKDSVLLITGADGFVGQHIINHLQNIQYTNVHGTAFRPESASRLAKTLGNNNVHTLDLTNQPAVTNLLATLQPKGIIHLAARASVNESYQQAEAVLNTNTKLQLVMLEAIKEAAKQARLISLGSAQAYGVLPAKYQAQPINEEAPFYPSNPYAVSKATQELLSRAYQLSYQLDIIHVRPFNQIGPGQSTDFALPSFADQIVKIENGEQDKLLVGNLEAVRDFTDVRDAAKAYEVLLRQGVSGKVYNLGSGAGVTMKEVVQKMVALAKVKIEIETDPSRLRPVDVPHFVADISKLNQLGWQPETSLEQTLGDILESARQANQ